MKNQQKVYIAGKVSGEPYEACKAKFASQAEILRKQGYEVINPMELVPPEWGKTAEGWNKAMRLCIKHIVECDAFYMLPCWRKSRGANIEFDLMLALGLQNLNGKL